MSSDDLPETVKQGYGNRQLQITAVYNKNI